MKVKIGSKTYTVSDIWKKNILKSDTLKVKKGVIEVYEKGKYQFGMLIEK